MQSTRFLLFVSALVSGAFVVPTVFAANFEIQTKDGAEQGFSTEVDCDGSGDKCVAAYFCSNDIWLQSDAFDRLQALRYAGEQLVIVKDDTPICAVN